MRPAASVLQDVTRVCDSWSDGPGPNVALVGAEPFAHPELPLLVQGAARAGCERIRLRTDAGALPSGGNAAGVVAAGVRHLEVVLLGGVAPVHDALVGRAGAFDAALAGVAAFVSAAGAAGSAVAVTGRVPVCRHNRDEVAGAVAALAAAGAIGVELAPAAGTALDEDRLRSARETAVVNGVWLHVAGARDLAPWRLVGGAS